MSKSFSIIPGDAKLAKMDRDLSFYACSNANPKTLLKEQIRSFNGTGSLSGWFAFSSEKITAARSYFDRLLEKLLVEGSDSCFIS
ncbi:MAG: hypothetical protein M2R45_03123 [Verrucomicrobia subdivision 3 bacterium]|nr:hypothetical protein [Limisphaerales bacterium]MCS1413191.1 hypothetical protein [Limisphaerales bacterium]